MASDPLITTIHLPVLLWIRVIRDLRRRGAGKGESGAFLLGRQHGMSGRVTTYISYDDLDPHAHHSGGIAFHASGYAALWQYCRERHLQVIADVHTHPGNDVRQSWIDQQHPMVPVVGHTAMIVPNFAHTSWWSLSTVGMYEYLGDFNWRTNAASERPRRVRLRFWGM